MLIAIWCLVILFFIACILLYRILIKLEYSNDRIHRIWTILENIDRTAVYFLKKSEDKKFDNSERIKVNNTNELLDRIEDKLDAIVKNTKKYD